MTKESIIKELRKDWLMSDHHAISVMLDKLELLGLIRFDQPKSKVDLIVEAWNNDWIFGEVTHCNKIIMAKIAIRVLEQK